MVKYVENDPKGESRNETSYNKKKINLFTIFFNTWNFKLFIYHKITTGPIKHYKIMILLIMIDSFLRPKKIFTIYKRKGSSSFRMFKTVN